MSGGGEGGGGGGGGHINIAISWWCVVEGAIVTASVVNTPTEREYSCKHPTLSHLFVIPLNIKPPIP